MWARLEEQPAFRRFQRFWLEDPIAPEVQALFRLVFFGVLALDMWLQIDHAPRYGAGDFNVSHLPALDSILPLPGRPVIVVLLILQSYLAGLFAFGGGGRAAVIALAALNGAWYFSSQLDSYQHHYLLFLILLLCCFVPWDQRRAPKPSHATWPLRLILVQISIVYLFAAISKMDPVWLEGKVLAVQASSGWARDLVEGVGLARASVLIVLTELALAVGIHIKRLRWIVAPLGIAFHLGIEASGFQIGLFSYFMVALYLLVLPERWVVAAVRAVRGLPRPNLSRIARFAPPARVVLRVAAIALGGALLLLVPLGAPARAAASIAFLLGAVGLVAVDRELRDRAALAHLGACLLVAVVARPGVTDTARDYYRFWGGSARRLGDLATATAAYERAVEVAPGHAQSRISLARLYARTGKIDRAIEEAARAQALEPDNYRGHVVEAMARDAAGEGEAALAAAERALDLDPRNADARSIAARWRNRLGLPPLPPPPKRASPGPDEDDE